jgi:choline dehydrogenase-like flavoprotein
MTFYTRFHDEILVLGGGAAGLCTALALAAAGRRVTLLERDPVLFNRASLRNEGKIHLGLIYAAESGRATADLQLRGALCFDRLLSEWTKGASQVIRVSSAFRYLVHADSLLAPAQLEQHYDHVESRCREAFAQDRGARYLGARPDRLWRRMPKAEMKRWFTPETFLAGYQTEERAIDPTEMGHVLAAAVSIYPNLAVRTGHHVRTVRRGPAGFMLEGSGPDGTWRAEAGQVVNATWDDLYRLDLEAGLKPPKGWLMRMKYRVLAHLPEHLADAPSATLVLGPFGDVVVRPDRTAYLSWYPTGLQGWSHDLQMPPDWDAPCAGREDPARAAEIAARIMTHIDGWMPGIGRSTPYQIDAGAILAHGRTDVDDPQSGLHGRMDSGVTSLDGWHSLNPGKLTTAPLFAAEVAVVVTDGARV